MFDEIFVLCHDVIGINAIGDAQHQVVLKVVVMILEHKGVEDLVCTDRGNNRLLPNQANARPRCLVGTGDGFGSESPLTAGVGLHRPSQNVIDVFDRQGGREEDDILRFRRARKELDYRPGRIRASEKVI